MNDFAKSATNDFVQAVRGEDLVMVARRLDSLAFKEQAQGFIRNRWAGKTTEEILKDLQNADHGNSAIHNIKAKEWDVFHSIGYAGAFDLIPLAVFKQIPAAPFLRYQYKWDQNAGIDGYETMLSAFLRKRGVPKEYKGHMKSLENLPSYSKHEALPRKVIEDVHMTVGSMRVLHLADPFLPDCKDAPWYDEYTALIERYRSLDAPYRS